MARRKTNSAARRKPGAAKSSRRAIWKGSINFGLVNVPVALHTAESSAQLDFDLLDRRNFAPVHYRRVNEETGREVPWDQIVKGYQYKKGEYVALSGVPVIRSTAVMSLTSLSLNGPNTYWPAPAVVAETS